MKTLIITEKEEIEQIIAKCTVCFVGLADTDLIPYVIPMNFGYKEGDKWNYSLFVPHNIRDIINLKGGIICFIQNGLLKKI